MPDKTVGELRAGAARVRALIVDLDEVVTTRVRFDGVPQGFGPPFDATTKIQLRTQQADEVLQVWARYVTKAEVTQEEGEPETDDDEDRIAWRATIELRASFELEGEVGDLASDDVYAFASIDGVAAMHPYARQTTQFLTASSRYPAFTMGLVDLYANMPDAAVVDIEDNRDED